MKCEGLSVALASDGYEAVKNCENENFDLIILDVRMPKLDGLGACRKIREFSSTPIIFLSAYGEEKNFLDAYKNGGDDYIVKPFPLAILYEKIIAVIKRNKGISDEDKGKIWEVFSKNADNDIIQSHGMGLAICKKILELHSFKYGFINKLAGVEFYLEVK